MSMQLNEFSGLVRTTVLSTTILRRRFNQLTSYFRILSFPFVTGCFSPDNCFNQFVIHKNLISRTVCLPVVMVLKAWWGEGEIWLPDYDFNVCDDWSLPPMERSRGEVYCHGGHFHHKHPPFSGILFTCWLAFHESNSDVRSWYWM